jgi:hypothetical protein
MRSVSDACGQFQQQAAMEQRALLSALMAQATWKAGEFEWVLKSPYQILAHLNSVSRSKEREKPGSGLYFDNWLPRPDSNCQAVD